MFFGYLFGIDQVSSDVRKSSPTVFWHPEAGDIQIRFKSVTSEGKGDVGGCGSEATLILSAGGWCQRTST